MREETRLWFEDAKDSFETAKDNLGLQRHNVTVFFCQQALEKALKGSVLFFRKRLPPKSHNLKEIYRRVERYIPLSPEDVEFLGLITPHYATTRYVDVALALPRDVYSEGFARECLEKTGRVLQRILSRIEESER